MLGGGKFTIQNKKLPGTYINFVSATKASQNMSERGIAAVALELNWGNDTDIFSVNAEDFVKNSLKIFGYNYADEALKKLRELFINVKTLHIYRLNNAGDKATNTFATAKYSGTRGNDLRVVIVQNIDDPSMFDVSLYLGTTLVDKQTVASSADLIDNDFVVWNKNAELAPNAGISLAGGTNGTVDGEAHQTFLDKLETYGFNALCCASSDNTIKQLYINYTKRMRDEIGVKFQTVVHNATNADYEGIVNVKNEIVTDVVSEKINAIYWVTGIIASCAINKSNTNKIYDGEYEIAVNYTQSQLEECLDRGEFVLHKVGDDVRVLEDINSLVTLTDEKGEDFKSNQTIRVIDQVATDISTLFNTRYLGNVQNNASGRVSLWNDIVSLYKQYYQLQAIEDFDSTEIVVEQGDDRKSVVVDGNIKPVNCMSKLYMTVVIE